MGGNNAPSHAAGVRGAYLHPRRDGQLCPVSTCRTPIAMLKRTGRDIVLVAVVVAVAVLALTLVVLVAGPVR